MSLHDTLLRVLEGRGEQPTDSRRGLCPLLQPLSRDEGGTTALLRWPTPPKGMPAPVVRQVGMGVRLLASSTEQFLHRIAVMREAAGREPGLDEVYVPGTQRASSLPVHAYLLMKVGGLPEPYEALALRHEEKGDLTAALVTLDRCASLFPDWGRYQVMRAQLFQRLERPEEARDAARGALVQPLWTLGAPAAEVATIAGLTIKVGGMEDRIRDLEAAAVNAMELFPSEAPLDTREGPTVVELMPKRRGRPRKENNG